MDNKKNYVITSLSLHLFFSRIMKEHAFFLETGFMPRDAAFAKEANYHKTHFEKLLTHTVEISNGLLPSHMTESGEFVTRHTLKAEKQTQFLTGISIDQSITVAENVLKTCENPKITQGIIHQVKQLNRHALRLLNGIISFKERILTNMLSCQMAVNVYPTFMSHIIHEAKMYRKCIRCIETKPHSDCNTRKQEQQFWDQIMKEHAMFITGLLDPTEEELMDTSRQFADTYKKFLDQTEHTKEINWESLTENTLKETLLFRDFKDVAVKDISDCKIKSMILPLLADHVLREANYYLRLLQEALLS